MWSRNEATDSSRFRVVENYPSSLVGYRLRAPLAGDGPAYRRRVARSTPALGKVAGFPGRRRRRNFPGGNVASGGTQSSRDHFSTCSTRALGRVSCAPCACVCVWPPRACPSSGGAARRPKWRSHPSATATVPPASGSQSALPPLSVGGEVFAKRTSNTLHFLSPRNNHLSYVIHVCAYRNASFPCNVKRAIRLL